MKKLLLLAMGLLMFAAAKAADKPEYPGGQEAMNQYIAANMKYPETARQNGIEGEVDIAFTVKADGSIGAIKIMRMIDPDLEAEAVRLVKNMPAWTPAQKDGQAVDSQAQIQILFTL